MNDKMLLCHKAKQTYGICKKMDTTGDYHVKQIKSVSGR